MVIYRYYIELKFLSCSEKKKKHLFTQRMSTEDVSKYIWYTIFYSLNNWNITNDYQLHIQLSLGKYIIFKYY